MKGKFQLNFVISNHARLQIMERGLTEADVLAVAKAPQQVILEKNGRKAYQSIVTFRGRTALLRVIVYDDKDPALIITAYATTNIARYWQVAYQ